MQPAVVFGTVETSFSHQAGGAGFSRHLVRMQSLPASMIPFSVSSAPLKYSICETLAN